MLKSFTDGSDGANPLIVSGKHRLPLSGNPSGNPVHLGDSCLPWKSLAVCSLKLSVTPPKVSFIFVTLLYFVPVGMEAFLCVHGIWRLSLLTSLLVQEDLKGKSCSLWCVSDNQCAYH